MEAEKLTVDEREKLFIIPITADTAKEIQRGYYYLYIGDHEKLRRYAKDIANIVIKYNIGIKKYGELVENIL